MKRSDSLFRKRSGRFKRQPRFVWECKGKYLFSFLPNLFSNFFPSAKSVENRGSKKWPSHLKSGATKELSSLLGPGERVTVSVVGSAKIRALFPLRQIQWQNIFYPNQPFAILSTSRKDAKRREGAENKGFRLKPSVYWLSY